MPNFNIEINELERVFFDYREFSPVFAGGQGCVFRCRNSAGEIVALKVFNTDFDHASERFDREVVKLRAINSPNVVRLIDSGIKQIQGRMLPFSISEWISAGSLLDRLKTCPWTNAEVKCLLLDCATGISAIWETGTIHRDIKPSNIMQRGDGKWVLIDLGVARHLGHETITGGGGLGTMGYMSPEQAQGKRELTFRSDLFSLGIVAYFAATGLHPFNNDQSLIGTAYKPRQARGVNLNISSDSSGLIGKLLEKAAHKRAADMATLISSIEGLGE